jgi:hypothetical protein
MRLIALIGISAVLSACGDGTSITAREAKFYSMQSCLEKLEKETNSRLRIVTDTPTQVSGSLDNGQPFGCEVKETGTQGTYIRGWFWVKELN